MAPRPTTLDLQFLKPGEIAEQLKVDPSTVYKWMKSGELPCVNVGPTAKRVPRAAFEAFLRARSGDDRVPVLDPATGEVTLRDVADIGGDTSLAGAAGAFEAETGLSPTAFCEQWRAGAVEDTPQTAQQAIRALALREALVGHGV